MKMLHMNIEGQLAGCGYQGEEGLSQSVYQWPLSSEGNGYEQINSSLAQKYYVKVNMFMVVSDASQGFVSLQDSNSFPQSYTGVPTTQRLIKTLTIDFTHITFGAYSQQFEKNGISSKGMFFTFSNYLKSLKIFVWNRKRK